MSYSYSQISQYVSCPRRYRYRYLDGWQESQVRASTLFGRVFEQALASYFCGDDCHAAWSRGWSEQRTSSAEFARSDDWDKMYRQGGHLLTLFAQQDRVRIENPFSDQQLRVARSIANREYIGYIDAIGRLDGTPCVLDWKTTSACYPASPAGLVQLDTQLISYSWLTGIPDVALVVFVRKRIPEIQYLRATITEQQRVDYAALVASAITRIEAAEFPAHTGIRFPQQGCLSCAYVGLCLGNEEMVASQLLRRRQGLDWLDELVA